MNDIIFQAESYAELKDGRKISVNPGVEKIEDNIYCISAFVGKNVEKIVLGFEIPCAENYPNLMIHDI